MNSDHEKYVHFQFCLTSLNRAWGIIDSILLSDERNGITRAAYELALIEYAKPFKISFGYENRRHSLSTPNFSEDELALHNRLLRLRDKVLAHTDIPEKDVKVYLGSSTDPRIPMMIQNTGPDLPELERTQELIETVLNDLYTQLPKIEDKLYSAL